MSSNKIIITSNIKNQEKKGIKIIAKDYTINDDISNNGINYFNNLKIYFTRENREKNKNKIILCARLIDRNELDDQDVLPKNEHYNLITRYNIKNNIIHFNYYKKNENRLIFKKSNVTISNDLFLFDFSNNVDKDLYFTINDISFLYSIENAIDNSFIFSNYNLYYSYKNSDYYNFKFSDFVNLSDHTTNKNILENNYSKIIIIYQWSELLNYEVEEGKFLFDYTIENILQKVSKDNLFIIGQPVIWNTRLDIFAIRELNLKNFLDNYNSAHINESIFTTEQKLKEKLSYLKINSYSLIDFFCIDKKCLLFQIENDKYFFTSRDFIHISDYFSQKIGLELFNSLVE